MAEFKLAIGDSKSKKTLKAELKSPDADQLVGKKVGDKFRGELLGLMGYEFEITGGSDKSGFPMRKDVEGLGIRRLLLAGKTVGFKPSKKFKGIRQRKSVRGNTISADTSQVNCKVIKWGEKPLFEEKPKEEAKPAEEKKE